MVILICSNQFLIQKYTGAAVSYAIADDAVDR